MAGVPVKRAVVVEHQDFRGAGAELTSGAHVEFGRLTRSQFDALSKAFGGQSKVVWDANRSFSARDFLPPTVQALVGSDLDTGPAVTFPKTKSLGRLLSAGREPSEVSIGVTPNCHGTAWEAMRAFQGQHSGHVQLAFGDAFTLDPMFRAFTSVARAGPGEALDLSRLRPGDVLNVHSSFEGGDDLRLLHSAVYVGGGLFFEKPNTELDDTLETPWRVATLAQVKAGVESLVDEGTTLSLHARRPREKLRAPSEAFAARPEVVSQLEVVLARRGLRLDKPLVRETVMGLAGAVQGEALNAVLTLQVGLDESGRGVRR